MALSSSVKNGDVGLSVRNGGRRINIEEWRPEGVGLKVKNEWLCVLFHKNLLSQMYMEVSL